LYDLLQMFWNGWIPGQKLNEKLSGIGLISNSAYTISTEDVALAMCKFEIDKGDGNSDLNFNHIKYSGVELFADVARLLSRMLMHHG